MKITLLLCVLFVFLLTPCIALAQGDGASELPQAAKNGDLKKVIELIQSGVDPNSQDGNGITPLLEATAWGHTDIAKVLLENGADINQRDKNDWSPIRNAACGVHAETYLFLIHHNPDPVDVLLSDMEWIIKNTTDLEAKRLLMKLVEERENTENSSLTS